jgi:predicted amino acid-binding ACT domain protein
MNREQNFRRYSMNIPNVEQERLQGWLTIANAIETGQCQ